MTRYWEWYGAIDKRVPRRRGLPLQGSSFVLSYDASTWYILREEQHDNSVTVAIADGPFPSRRSAERRQKELSA